MYTATIGKPRIQGGKLQVDVVFDDGKGDAFSELYESTQAQSSEWPRDLVTEKLDRLNSLEGAMKALKSGKVDASRKKAAAAPEVSSTARDEYEKDLQLFERFVNVLAKGFTTQENKDFIALRQKLTKNFKPEYLDMF